MSVPVPSGRRPDRGSFPCPAPRATAGPRPARPPPPPRLFPVRRRRTAAKPLTCFLYRTARTWTNVRRVRVFRDVSIAHLTHWPSFDRTFHTTPLAGVRCRGRRILDAPRKRRAGALLAAFCIGRYTDARKPGRTRLGQPLIVTHLSGPPAFDRAFHALALGPDPRQHFVTGRLDRRDEKARSGGTE